MATAPVKLSSTAAAIVPVPETELSILTGTVVERRRCGPYPDSKDSGHQDNYRRYDLDES